MKKFLGVILAMMMCFSLCTCGDDAKSEALYNIGDVIETETFNYTLTNLEFVDGIKCDKGEDFFTPGTEGHNILNAAEGHKLLYFSFEYEYVGKSSLESRCLENVAFVPSITYKDYNLDSSYFVFWRVIDGSWYNLASDVSWTVRQSMGLAYSDLIYTYEPLTDKKYEVHGAMSVPLKVFEDTETEMLINFQLLKNIEENNNIFDLYKYRVR